MFPPTLSDRGTCTCGSEPGLLDALRMAIRDAVATGSESAFVLIDLRDFAGVNARLGRTAGDQLLAEAEQRIGSYLADHAHPQGVGLAASFGRLDSDHFVVIARTPRSWTAFRTHVAEVLQSIMRPCFLNGVEVRAAARAAIVRIPAHGRSPNSVLARAFRLLNGDARTNTDLIAVSDDSNLELAPTNDLEADLRRALHSDEMFIVLQPKVGASTGIIQGAEALVRWRHPQLGFIPPPTFVAAAERAGLIVELGLKVLRETCRALRSIPDEVPGFSIAVNVSAFELKSPGFLTRFLEVVDRECVQPEALAIELTETSAVSSDSQIETTLGALRRCGIGIAIDDFGTGYSNLAALSTTHADTLKVDRSLVAHDENDPRAAALLSVAIHLARVFGLKTVAEGVETAAQLDRVQTLGFDYVQGYLTGRPAPVSEFVNNLREDGRLARHPKLAC